MDVHPILLEVFKNRFSSIAEEMGVTLVRTAFSPNIKERRDCSCAVFNRNGDTVAQAAHIPVHLGSMPLSVKSAIESVGFRDGDMAVLNDPFKGGTHLPDITVVAPVFFGGSSPSFYVANRAHHADVGGEGDFAAQVMSNVTGVRRIIGLLETHGLETLTFYADRLIDYSETITRKAIESIPDGVYEFEDVMEDDGKGHENIRIHVRIQVEGDGMTFDFGGSDDQVRGGVNAVYAITLSAVLYVLRSLISEDIPPNAGCLKPIRVKTRKGSVVDARFPAGVAAGNVETSQRIVDVVLGALSKAVPDRVPAAGQGTMNNVTIVGIDPRTDLPFAYYETLAGGMGASAGGHGEHAVHSHMTNTMNTPVEALEYSYPFLVTEYSIREGSGGKGRFNGGNGLTREIRLLSDAEVTVLSERRRVPPYGLMGGSPGKTVRNVIARNGAQTEQPGKFNEILSKGDVVRIETPGGGGYGEED
ncbi:MAG: hydantoinase B/oxoprolinase family protein [Deltaproteobacteria bacterium]|nr:hydantoinase B/oxoprolinase family protein [Deltaproteobacteria bacterium]